jgi:hypothetical protein
MKRRRGSALLVISMLFTVWLSACSGSQLPGPPKLRGRTSSSLCAPVAIATTPTATIKLGGCPAEVGKFPMGGLHMTVGQLLHLRARHVLPSLFTSAPQALALLRQSHASDEFEAVSDGKSEIGAEVSGCSMTIGKLGLCIVLPVTVSGPDTLPTPTANSGSLTSPNCDALAVASTSMVRITLGSCASVIGQYPKGGLHMKVGQVLYLRAVVTNGMPSFFTSAPSVLALLEETQTVEVYRAVSAGKSDITADQVRGCSTTLGKARLCVELPVTVGR